jgi:hypothetical protein
VSEPEVFASSGNFVLPYSVVTHHYSGAATFLTEGNIPVSLHALFVLIVEQDIVLVHDAVLFFLREYFINA